MGSASHGAVTALSQVEIVSFSDVALLEGSIFQANISKHSFTIQADLSKTWAEHISEIISSNAQLFTFCRRKTDGKIISKYNKIQGIHQPTPYLDGYLAADRNCGEESIIVLAADGTQKKLFTGDFLLVRGIERLGGDHFLITSATTVSEISLDGKIHYKAHVKGVSSTAEIGITNTRKLSNIGSCGPKTLYQAVPTALKKQER